MVSDAQVVGVGVDAADDCFDGYAARLEADLAAMRRLYELQAKLAFETDLKAALSEIVTAAAEFTRTDRGCVQLVSEDGERLEMFVHRGYAPDSSFIRHFLGQGSKPACDAARQDQQRIIIDDVATFPAILDTEDRRVALADDVRATQSTPMVSRKGALVGVLSTQFRQPHRPAEHELKLVDMLAWTAADFVDRHLTEAALRRANDARYRKTLEIDTVPLVFFDLVGGITDANDAFLAMIGYTRAELAAGEIRYENLTPSDWAWRDERTIAELLETGKSTSFEKEYFRRDGSRIWIHCTAKMLDDHTAVEFIIDVTERKKAEQALRASEERQVFLLGLSDRLRPLIDPSEIMATASAALGRHLGVGQVAYAETDLSGMFATIAREWNDGSIPSNVGDHRLQDFGPAFIADLKRGETIVIPDVTLDPRTSSAEALATFARVSIGSFLNVPLVKAAGLAAVLAVHGNVSRPWSAEEIALTKETAERTWAAVERARAEKALRESEARHRTLFEAMDEGYLLADVIFAESGEVVDIAYVAANPAATRMVGIELTGRTLREVSPDYERYWYEIWGHVARTGQGKRLERYAAHEDLWYDFYVFKPEPENPESQRVAVVFQEVTERKHAEAVLRESEERLRLAIDVGHLATWDWNLDKGAVSWSDEHYRIHGYKVGEVTPSYEAWVARVHPDDLPGTEAALTRARDEHLEYVQEFRTLHPDGTVRWCDARGQFFYDPDGRPVRMIGTMLDTTERREWAERQQVLVAELQHRTRNLLTVVRSIAQQTMAQTGATEAFREQFNDRLSALSRVQGLLSRSDHEPITIGILIQTELDALGAGAMQDRIHLDGPPVRLRKAHVQTLSLALHELATNARKYGALTIEGGQLRVTWRTYTAEGDGQRLALEWIEDGIIRQREEQSLVTHGGYGRELIERALPYALDAKTRYELDETQVRCFIDLPLTERTGQKGSR